MLLAESPFNAYSIWSLLLYEVPIFFIEIIVLSPLLYIIEKPTTAEPKYLASQAIIFVLAANTASLVLGFFLLAYLPL
jgi:hypothetical protein